VFAVPVEKFFASIFIKLALIGTGVLLLVFRYRKKRGWLDARKCNQYTVVSNFISPHFERGISHADNQD